VQRQYRVGSHAHGRHSSSCPRRPSFPVRAARNTLPGAEPALGRRSEAARPPPHRGADGRRAAGGPVVMHETSLALRPPHPRREATGWRAPAFARETPQSQVFAPKRTKNRRNRRWGREHHEPSSGWRPRPSTTSAATSLMSALRSALPSAARRGSSSHLIGVPVATDAVRPRRTATRGASTMPYCSCCARGGRGRARSRWMRQAPTARSEVALELLRASRPSE
jgi:hypothetical protein